MENSINRKELDVPAYRNSIPYTFGNCALFIFKAICKTIGGGTAKLYFIQFYIPDYRSKL